MITVIVNGESTSVEPDSSIQETIEALGFADRPYAVAVNEVFVPKQQHSTTKLEDGDALEVVSPIQGG